MRRILLVPLLISCKKAELTEQQLELQESQIELLQEQNLLLKEQVSQLEVQVTTLQTNWENTTPGQRLNAVETNITDIIDDIDLIMSVVTEQDGTIRTMDGDLDEVKLTMLVDSDLDPYATEAWVNSEFTSEDWVTDQDYATNTIVGVNTTAINQNTAFISNNTGTITNFNTRLLVIENGYVQSTDLVSFATEAWVTGQQYAVEADVLANTLSLEEQTITIVDHDQRLGAIELSVTNITDDYISSGSASDFVTNSDLATLNLVSQSDISPWTDQVGQNTTDILSVQSSVTDIENAYVTQNELVGLATEDWVNSNAGLGSIVSNLSDYMSVDANNNQITITGANLNIVSGSGYTDDSLGNSGTLLGLGNVIIGYNEADVSDVHTGSHNLIVGSGHSYSAISGVAFGENADLTGDYSTILGGYSGSASGNHATIVGGFENAASGNHSVVSGGYQNESMSSFASISGGGNNIASANKSSVHGGTDNTASGAASTVLGGDANESTALNSAVLGGALGESSANHSVVVGGYNNIANGQYSSILGGAENITNGTSSSISGGYQNIATGLRTTVSGGYSNTVIGSYSSILGGYLNNAHGILGTISGGAENIASGEYSNVTGGYSNESNGNYSVVTGGINQSASNLYSVSP